MLSYKQSFLCAVFLLSTSFSWSMDIEQDLVTKPDSFRLSANIKTPEMRQWLQDNKQQIEFYMQVSRYVFPLGTVRVDEEVNGRVPIHDHVPIFQADPYFRIFLNYTDPDTENVLTDICLFRASNTDNAQPFTDRCDSWRTRIQKPGARKKSEKLSIVEAIRLDLDFNLCPTDVPIRTTGLVLRKNKYFGSGTLTSPSFGVESIYPLEDKLLTLEVLENAYKTLNANPIIQPIVHPERHCSYIGGNDSEEERPAPAIDIPVSAVQKALSDQLIDILEDQLKSPLPADKKVIALNYLIHKGEVSRAHLAPAGSWREETPKN